MRFDINNPNPIATLIADVQASIQRTSRMKNQYYSTIDGRMIPVGEILQMSTDRDRGKPIMGALYIAYSKDSFLSVDRIVREGSRFRKKRRIINYLDSRSGQISSAVLLELLKLKDGQDFSKNKFVPYVDKVYFNGKPISSGEINEVVGRMLRKTMIQYFAIEGRKFRRSNFPVGILNLPARRTYPLVKHTIDSSLEAFITSL